MQGQAMDLYSTLWLTKHFAPKGGSSELNPHHLPSGVQKRLPKAQLKGKPTHKVAKGALQ